jgi:peptidyl-prolyl cis-trans isomerase D
VKAAHTPDFAEYKSHILDDYRDQKVPQLVQQETAKLSDRAKVLNDLKKAAAEFKVPVKSSDLVGEDAQVPDLGAMNGPGAVAFSLAKGAISAPIAAGQAGVVLTVTDKQEPNPAEIAQHMDQTREQLLSAERDQVFRVFLGDLSEKYQKGGGVRMTKQVAPPGGAPGGTPAGS